MTVKWMSLLFGEFTPEDRRYVTLFAGYFDDSGTDASSPVAVIAGFVARPSDWLGFDSQWAGVLQKYGVAVHHQNKWSNRAKPFDDPKEWPTDRLHAYLNELIDVIATRQVISVGAGIPVERFYKCLSPKAQATTSPIGVAAQCLFTETMEFLKPVPDARIAYVFASGTPGYAEIQKRFDAIVAFPDAREMWGLVSLTDADIRQIVRLQAADIVAYEVFRFLRGGDDDLDIARGRYPLQEIAQRIKCSWITPHEESLRNSSRAFEYSPEELMKKVRRRHGR